MECTFKVWSHSSIVELLWGVDDPLFSNTQYPGRAEESQARPKNTLGRSLPDVGLEKRAEFREDQLQPLEPPLPQAAAQPHEVRVEGPQALQYPSAAKFVVH